MSIVTKIIAKGTREVGAKVVVIFPLAFAIISPMRVLVPWILVALLALGYYCFGFFLSFWNYSTNELDFPYSIVQKSEYVEWERVEQN